MDEDDFTKSKLPQDGLDLTSTNNDICISIRAVFTSIGNTEIERIRKQGEKTIQHDRIIFDTVDEAMELFNESCGEFVGCYA